MLIGSIIPYVHRLSQNSQMTPESPDAVLAEAWKPIKTTRWLTQAKHHTIPQPASNVAQYHWPLPPAQRQQRRTAKMPSHSPCISMGSEETLPTCVVLQSCGTILPVHLASIGEGNTSFHHLHAPSEPSAARRWSTSTFFMYSNVKIVVIALGTARIRFVPSPA